MSQLCIHTQLPSNFCTFKYWKKSIQYTSKCTGIWIKTQPWLKHHIHMRIIQKVPITPGTTVVQEAIQFSLSLLEWVEWLNPCLNQSDLMIPFIHDLQTSLVISQLFTQDTECLGFTERYQHHWFLRVVRNGLTRP